MSDSSSSPFKRIQRHIILLNQLQYQEVIQIAFNHRAFIQTFMLIIETLKSLIAKKPTKSDAKQQISALSKIVCQC